MRPRILVPIALCWSAVLALSACTREPDFVQHSTRESIAGLAPAQKTAEPRAPKAAAEKPAESAHAGARGLLARVPRNALFVVRLPHLERLEEAWGRSAFAHMLSSPSGVAAMLQVRAGIESARAQIEQQSPGVRAILDLAPKLAGELVLSVNRAEFDDGSHESSAPLIDFTVLVDAGARAGELRDAIDTCLASRPAGVGIPLRPAKSGWGYSGGDAKGRLDVRCDGTCVAIRFSGFEDAGKELAGAVLAADDSFAANDVARDALDLAARDAVPCVEVFFNLVPIWDAVRKSASPEALATLESSGFLGVRGGSFVAGLEGRGLTEALTWSAPDHKDLISRTFANAKLDRGPAHWIPASAEHVGLVTLDLKALFDGIVAMVPKDSRAEFDRELLDVRKKSGIDLRALVFENLGPTFAFAGSFGADARGAMTVPKAAFVIGVRDDSKAQRLMDQIVEVAGLSQATRKKTYLGQRMTVLDLPSFSGPDGSLQHLQPGWCFDKGVLVVASDVNVLRDAIAATQDSAVTGHDALARALAQQAGDGTFAIVCSSGTVERPDSLAVGKRTPAGFVFEERGGSGAIVSGGVLGTVAIASSVAIPKLMALRIEANEVAAANFLTNVARAELMFRDGVVVDSDGDGLGEYGTLEELCAAAPVRGSNKKVEPPILVNRFGEWRDGIGQRSGYVFRVDLGAVDGPALAQVRPGAQASVDCEHAERHFIAYAWPLSYPMTGRRVFAVDNQGAVFFSDNYGMKQQYSGFDNVPPHGAAFENGRMGEIEGGDFPWTGGDGCKWTWYQVPPKR